MYKYLKKLFKVLLICCSTTTLIMKSADKHIEKDFVIESKKLGQTIHISPSTMPNSFIEDAQKFVNASGVIPFEGAKIFFPLLKSILLTHIALVSSNNVTNELSLQKFIDTLLSSEVFENQIQKNAKHASQAMRIINRYAHLFCHPQFTRYLLNTTIKLVAQSWADADESISCRADSLNYEYHEALARYYYLASNTSGWYLKYNTDANNETYITPSHLIFNNREELFWLTPVILLKESDMLSAGQTGSLFMQDPHAIQFVLTPDIFLNPEMEYIPNLDLGAYKVIQCVRSSEGSQDYSVRLLTKIGNITQLPALVQSVIDTRDYQDYTMNELLISFNTFTESELIKALKTFNLAKLRDVGLSFNPGLKISSKSIKALFKDDPFIYTLRLSGTQDQKMTVADDIYPTNTRTRYLAIENSESIPQEFLHSFKELSNLHLSTIAQKIDYPIEIDKLTNLKISRTKLSNNFSLICPNLVKLNLSKTHLQELPAQILENSKLLEEINVSHNKLNEIPEEFILWAGNNEHKKDRTLRVADNPFKENWLLSLTGKKFIILFGEEPLIDIFTQSLSSLLRK